MLIRDGFYTAKKKHVCDDCGRTIQPGEVYRRMFGACEYGDKPYELKLCHRCEGPSDVPGSGRF